VGGFRVLVGDEVTEFGGVIFTDRGFKRDRAAADTADAYYLIDVYLHRARYLFVIGVAVEFRGQRALHPVVFVDLLDHMNGDADGPPLVSDGPGDGLADPPRRVGRELETLAVVELLDGAHQSDVALLDQVQERDATAGVLLGYRDDEPQVRARQVSLGFAVAPLDALGEVDLLCFGEKGGFADLVKVHLDGVTGVACTKVAFEDLLDELGVLFFMVEGVVQEIRVDYLDAVFPEETVDLLDLVGREVHFLEQVEDFAGLQSSGLLAGLEEFLDFFYVPKITLGLQLLLWICLETLALLERNISETIQRSTAPHGGKGCSLLGLRNLYRVFHESRAAARKRSPLAVVGNLPEAVELANLLDAQRSTAGAEILLTVAGARKGGVEVSISGEAVEDAKTISLSAITEEAVLREFAPRVAHALDEDYLVSLGRGYPVFRRAVCEELIHKNARQNAVIGALPIPGADMPAITANQGRMVLGIAAVYGEEISLQRARELLGVLAAGFGLRALSRQVVKLVPVAGWAASGVIGYAGTLAMGRATILYFERGHKEISEREWSEILHRARQEGEDFLSRVRRRR
jgi:uncharacterized protein (DUF697 family)